MELLTEAWTRSVSVVLVVQRRLQLPQPSLVQHSQQHRRRQRNPFDVAAKPNPNDLFERYFVWAWKIPYENFALK